MLPLEQRLQTMLSARLATVIRANNAETALSAADALIAAGFRLIEVTMTVPGAVEAIRELARRVTERGQTDIIVGAGTVMSAADARRCIEAGAAFVVSPSCETDIIRPCRDSGVVAIPAGLTPTEIVHAWRLGAHFVKVFPAGSLGGPAYIKALRGPLPDIPLWVSGMVTAKEATQYFQAGTQLIGLGSELLPAHLVAAKDWAAVTQHAQQLRLLCES
jgi:2-dehydro-3-deoxyphosphogluconate aldolase / (4S)-4-hydroxy-2-oxoglutarate aldolase